MNWEEIFSGNAGPAGLQWALNSSSSRRLLRREAQKMLRPGYHAGTFHLTRAKFKPGRKLLAYFTFSAINGNDSESDPLHLAIAWQNELDDDSRLDGWSQLQAEANRSGLMPVQLDLWRDLPERGMRLQLWPFDPEFPQLVRLGNASYVTGVFESLGITRDRGQLPVITPIRYRPGERHVLRYEIGLRDAISGKGQRLYAKLYSNAEAAARAFRIANRVVDWLANNRLVLQGNKPQAISPADSIILYPHASGTPLSHQFHRPSRWLAAQLQIIGNALFTLHNAPETLQAELSENTFTNEAKVVKRASEHIQVLLPETYDKILEILDKAQERYSDLPQERPTFTHSDFKSDHILTTSQGLTLIDFDTCKLADPALDIGKFLADLDWWFTLKGIAGIEEAQAELLKGYGGAGKPDPLVHERLARARLFYALILVKIVARRVPLYQKEWTAMTARMIGRAAQILQETIAH
jgi:hypothetical protein